MSFTEISSYQFKSSNKLAFFYSCLMFYLVSEICNDAVTFTKMENITAFWPSVYLSSSFIHSTVDWLAKGEKKKKPTRGEFLEVEIKSS